jgi:hypothetical protein
MDSGDDRQLALRMKAVIDALRAGELMRHGKKQVYPKVELLLSGECD